MQTQHTSSVARISFIVGCLLITGFLSGLTLAQGTERADLLGTVRDSAGAAVPGATLTAVNTATNIRFTTVSDEHGNYAFRFLPAGRYTVKTEMRGFASVTVTDVVLQVNVNATVPITLKPEGIAEAITIEAASNRIETTDATVKHAVTNEQVRGLPVFTSTTGRSVLSQLAFLVPGVTSTTTLGGSDTRGEQISINGSRPSSVSFNFEGGDNNDHEFHRASSTLPNPDALQEFTVVTNNYKADLGRSTGGVINAVTKSGTNQFHGNLRYFLINEWLNARSFFDPARARRRLNTFGGNFGGPVRFPPKVFGPLGV